MASFGIKYDFEQMEGENFQEVRGRSVSVVWKRVTGISCLSVEILKHRTTSLRYFKHQAFLPVETDHKSEPGGRK